MTYSVLSVFAGIGGLDLAAHWAGFETVGFIEREPFCQKVLAKHWPGVPICSDVFDYHDTKHVDVVCGGFPCQPFSVAGNRKGADDERYLLPEMLRIIREVKPYVVLFENVPGFPSLSDGAEFKYLLRALAEMGFDAEWGHLRASDSGAPHQRERWFLVAYTKSGGLRERFTTRREGVGTQRPIKTVIPMAYAEYDGYLAATLKRSNGTPILNIEEGQNCTGEPTGINTPIFVADTDNTERETRRAVRMGAGKQTQPFTRCRKPQTGVALGNASSPRLERSDRRKSALRKRTRPGARATQSRLRGTPDGLPSGMDFVGWPARPGEDQYAYEPPRVTSAKTPDRAARLKALGNAVVPQVAFPLFVAIHEWLTARDAEQVA